MKSLLDAFWRAVAYCLHPKVIGLSLLPLLIGVALALGLGWFYWEAAVAGDDPPPERTKRWARTYLTWAASPEHQLVAPLTDWPGPGSAYPVTYAEHNQRQFWSTWLQYLRGAR